MTGVTMVGQVHRVRSQGLGIGVTGEKAKTAGSQKRSRYDDGYSRSKDAVMQLDCRL